MLLATIHSLGLRPKKRFGQNFLVDENILRSIANSLHLQPMDVVIEIGPGTGSLTKYLLPHVAHLVVVELDRDLAAYLRSNLAQYPNFTLVEDDFLKIDCRRWASIDHKVRIVGNIPYNITSNIIFHVFDQHHLVSDMTLLLQREVAERVVAEPKSKAYGILSVFSRFYADVRILFYVPATVFRPIPKVESALVQWRFTDERSQKLADEALFKRVVRTAFGQRRKMLRKSLRSDFDIEKLVDWDLTRRPEELDIDEWIRLANQLHGA